MEDLNLYNNLLNENYTDIRKNDLIQKVFENKTKNLIFEKSELIKMAEGGEVEEKVYTPYEFLHELLPQVYGRPYVVSDKVGIENNQKIAEQEKALDDYINLKLTEFNVKSIYQINDKVFIEEVEIRRRQLISEKSFITDSELSAYLFCHPELNSEHYVKELPNYDINFFISNGLIMVDYDTKNKSYMYVYVYEYLSGDLYEKSRRLTDKKEELFELFKHFQEGQFKFTEEDYDKQKSALLKNYPKKALITTDSNDSIFILPNSNFGEEYLIKPEDVVDIKLSYAISLKRAFVEWTESELDLALIKKSRTLSQVHNYFTYSSSRSSDDDETTYADAKIRAFIDGKVILSEFLNKGLTQNAQRELEHIWNSKYNNYTEPKFYKFPVACHFSNKFKNKRPFVPNETQIQSIQFNKCVGSGLLAYGVGVGKTASAILNISYAFDNNLCKKPILIVPNATYEKWKMEMFGGQNLIFEVSYLENENTLSTTFESQKKAEQFANLVNGTLRAKSEKIYGHIPHLNTQQKYVDLYNLNEEYVRNIKNYTDIEEIKISNISSLIIYLKTIPKDYNFLNQNINNQILEKYSDFNAETLILDFNIYVEQLFQIWISIKKNREQWQYDRDGAKQYFIENELKITIKEWFEKGIKIYREEMPYVLGEIKNYEDGTIFLGTYEALEHLGLVETINDNIRDNDSIFGKVYNEISQGDNVEDANYDRIRNIPVLFKNAIYGKIKTKIDITQLGVDYAIFDESHFFKKAITDCKGKPTYQIRQGSGTTMREPRKYSFGEGEFPSTIGLTAYFISRYLQITNEGKNVMHLTATPFTNKPAEIFSMLSLTNRNRLEASGFNYMEDFFDVFMDISYELIFGNTGVTRKESLLGYRNLPQLRNIIYSMMDYKSGEDANIKRPEKLLFPNFENRLDTKIPETPLQDDLFKQIKNYQRGKITYAELCADSVEEFDIDEKTEDELLDYVNTKGTDAQKEKYQLADKPLSEDTFDELKVLVKKLSEKSTELDEADLSSSDRDIFRVMRGLNLLKAVTLSPYLSTCQKKAGIEPTYQEYINSSPKLTYTLNCIKSIHDYELENNLRKSGCVIYMGIGVNVSYTKGGVKTKWKESGFAKIKDYLINSMGYSDNEIVLISGSTPNIEKERAKNSFLAGNSTILIGSSSISTGIDLQNNASSLFLCDFNWNPTDNEQISGRIHRQGNRFEKIRVVYPMVMNSADPNIFQQLYEKTLRIKNIWDKNDTGKTLDLKDFDVNSLRKGILDEPEDLANYWLEEQNEELVTLDIVLDRRLDDLRKARDEKQIFDLYTPQMKGMIVVIDAYKKFQAKAELKQKMDEKIGNAQEEYNEKVIELQQKLNEDDDFAKKYKDEMKKAKEKLEKLKDKAKEGIYDFENDPDGRFNYLTYEEIGDDDELLKKVNRFISNSDSVYSTFQTYVELEDIYKGWLRQNFPRFQEGKYDMSLTEEEDTISRNVDYQSSTPQYNANKWKGAYRTLKKVKQNLDILGIAFTDIPEAIDSINLEKQTIKQRLADNILQYPSKLQEYILAKEERLIIQPTIQDKVDEFSSYNDILFETVETFEEDRGNFVEIPLQELPIKPSVKKIKKDIEEAIIEEAIIEDENIVNTDNLIENIKNGMIIRFVLNINKKGNSKVVDIFYEDDEFIKYFALEGINGDILEEEEETLTEQQVIDYYISKNSFLTEEFYEDEIINEQEEIKEIEENTFGYKINENEFKLLQFMNGSDHTSDGNGIVAWIEDDYYGLSIKQLENIAKGLSKVGVLSTDIENVNDKNIMWASVNSDYQIQDDNAYGYYRLQNLIYDGKNIENFYDADDKIIRFPIPKEEEVEIIKTQIDRTQVEIYNDLIEGYQLALEIETDEQKIKMFNDLIEGYQLALELEN